MPLYEYQCTNGHKHDYLCHIANRDAPRVCPVCRAECRRVASPVRTTFRYADEKLKPYANR
jgi:putative FmdB family regulatory protein